jgi:hypothetical protein
MLETDIEAEPRGGAVTFTLRVTNHGTDDVELAFSDSQRVRVTVSPVGEDEPCWRSDEGQMFAQMLGSETVPADGAVAFEVVWKAPELGEYRAVGEVVCREEELQTETTFSVSP